jgi:HPt (histidine-containing phosphotransfer) domain-containing protein
MIDWARVSEPRDEVGAEDFDEVVELFLEEVDEAIIALRNLVDLSELETQCHFLKGSALNIGFRDFANLCQAGEAAAAAGQGGDMDIAAIVQSYTDARAVFINQSADRLVA